MTMEERCAAPGGALHSIWLARPLCRRYVLATFDAAAVRWRDAEHRSDRSVHWALGWLGDGDCEALGAWIESDDGSGGALGMLADLELRGVERIWHVTGTDVGPLHDRVSGAFFGTTVRSPAGRVRARALAAAQVRDDLLRALGRQGRFESEAAVLDFVAGALQRTERRLDRGGVMANVSTRQDGGAHGVPPGI